MTVAPPFDLNLLILDHGSHGGRDPGRDGFCRICLEEAVALAKGLDHTDAPDGVSPIIYRFGQRLNDRLEVEERQQLKRFVPDRIYDEHGVFTGHVRCSCGVNGCEGQFGTADDGYDDARTQLALDWLMTRGLPAWFDLAGQAGLAEESRAAAAAPLTAAERRAIIRQLRDKIWNVRQERWRSLRDQVKAKLAESRLADAVAVAAAVADAVAVAAAVADAAADAAAVAAAAADAPYSDRWYVAYTAAYKVFRKAYDESPAFEQIRVLREVQIVEVIELFDRMIHVGRAA